MTTIDELSRGALSTATDEIIKAFADAGIDTSIVIRDATPQFNNELLASVLKTLKSSIPVDLSKKRSFRFKSRYINSAEFNIYTLNVISDESTTVTATWVDKTTNESKSTTYLKSTVQQYFDNGVWMVVL